MNPLSSEDLARLVHRALRHLYEPAELQRSQLAALVGADRAGDPPSALRKILLDTIRALKPDARVALDSPAWRTYQVLYYRFEEQSTQEDVAAQMAVGPRQVRRLEHSAIRALASAIALRHNIALALDHEPELAMNDEEGAEEEAIAADEPAEPGTEQELDWLRRSYTLESASLSELIETALSTSQPLLAESGCLVSVDAPGDLPAIRGQVTTLRQVILNLLIAATHVAPGGQILLTAIQTGDHVRLDVQADCPPGLAMQAALPETAEVTEFVDLAERLLALSGGMLERLGCQEETGQPARLKIRAHLPTVEKAGVLFIDDNTDSLRLFERCLAGTRFQFIGARDPAGVLALAEDSRARVIVLDIMLPGIDGWELLGRIRAHPGLGGLPVVISTILPHEQLARSLGADAFLRKPVSRDTLLALLTELIPGVGAG
jgi:CheY-like chemotaxis protein